ncbi:MAG: class I SAM-dependent methyltransferase [Armatimonadota bacterium]|nr:class I SAM-dependent methyltransferase [bacterium]
MDNELITCNVCGSDVSKILLTKNGHDVYQCGKCGLAFTWPQPQAIADQYDASYFDLYRRRRGFRLKRGDTRLKQIELMKQPGKLLDIGCSLGYFIEAANARGWDASGIEISPHASEEARQMGLDARTGVLEDARYDDGSFDCVTMWDVLEHVPDPTKHMLEVNRILSDGGLVVIGTPNLGHSRFKAQRENWRHLKPAEHIFYFMESSISPLLGKTGFDVVYLPLFGGRSFQGSVGAAIRSGISRLVQLNDVMTIYGVKR